MCSEYIPRFKKCGIRENLYYQEFQKKILHTQDRFNHKWVGFVFDLQSERRVPSLTELNKNTEMRLFLVTYLYTK